MAATATATASKTPSPSAISLARSQSEGNVSRLLCQRSARDDAAASQQRDVMQRGALAPAFGRQDRGVGVMGVGPVAPSTDTWGAFETRIARLNDAHDTLGGASRVETIVTITSQVCLGLAAAALVAAMAPATAGAFLLPLGCFLFTGVLTRLVGRTLRSTRMDALRTCQLDLQNAQLAFGNSMAKVRTQDRANTAGAPRPPSPPIMIDRAVP